jgi:hypothetical protein
MGGVGDLTRSVADGIGGLIAGAATALVDAFWAVVQQGQAWLPGPLFPIVVGVGVVILLAWTLRK